MGIVRSKYKQHGLISLKICSLYADMTNMFSPENNIDKITHHYFSIINGHRLDILCLQGINSPSMRNQIIKNFQNEVERFNIKIETKIQKKLEIFKKFKKLKNKNKGTIEEERYKLQIEMKIELFYYPYDENKIVGSDEYETWSLDDVTTNDPNLYEKLIISRYKSIINISENIYDNTLNNKKQTPRKSSNIQLINIKINDSLVSLYNVDSNNIKTDEDFKQLTINIKRIIKLNEDTIKMSCYHEEINSRNIHILCGNFGIGEIKNNIMNKKYVKFIKEMNFIDILRYISGLRNKNNIKNTYCTNIFGTRNNFIMLLSKNCIDFSDIKSISEVIYNDNGIINVDAYIDDKFNGLFLHYPTTIMILLKKDWTPPKILEHVESIQEYISYKEIEFSDEKIRNIIFSESKEGAEGDEDV